jgi:hypothetical protein
MGIPIPGPPSHRDRARYHYRYYPSVSVYFDIDRSLYFYPRRAGGNGQSYPYGQEGLAALLFYDMDTDKPYRWHSDVEKRYPGIIATGIATEETAGTTDGEKMSVETDIERREERCLIFNFLKRRKKSMTKAE